MIRARRSKADRLTLVVGAAFAIAVAAFLGAHPSDAGTGAAGPVTVTVTPTDNVADGQAVSVHAEAPGDVEIFEIRVHLCQHDAGINDTYAFGFQDGLCPNAPVGAGDVDQRVELPRGTSVADLPAFKVGVGSVDWTDELGSGHSLTCGPGAPCDVVVQMQITNTTVFFTAPICYSDCPVAPDTPVAAAGAGAASPPAGGAQTATGATAAGGSSPAASGAGTTDAKGPKSSVRPGISAGKAQDSPELAAANAAVVVSSNAPSGAVRVLAGEAAGVIGGVLIVLIVVRGRRKMQLMELVA